MSRTTRHANRFTYTLLALVALSALLLAGCGQAATPPPSEPEAEPASSATEAPGPTSAPQAEAPESSGERPAGVPAPGESPTIDRILSNGVLRGGCAPTAPHCMIDPATNQYIGIGPDTGEELARRLGVEYETVGTSWDTIVPGLASGQYDAIITGLTFRPERDEVVDFVLLGEYGFCLLARADDDRVTSWESFVDNPELRLGQIAGVAEEAMVQADYPSINLVSMQTQSQSLWEEVLTGRVDGTLMGSLNVPIYLELAGGQLKAVPEDCLRAPLFGQAWGNAVPEGDTAFLEWLQTTMDELRTNGWWDEKVEYWYHPDQLRMGLDVE